MKLFRKSLMLILLFVICLGISSGIMSNAKEITLDVPMIKVKTVNDGSDIEITIEETKDAEGYEIYVSNNWDIYI